MSATCYPTNPCSANNKRTLVVVMNDKDSEIRMSPNRLVSRIAEHSAMEIILTGKDAMRHSAFKKVVSDIAMFKQVTLRTTGNTLQTYADGKHTEDLAVIGNALTAIEFDVYSPHMMVNKRLLGLKTPVSFITLSRTVMQALPRKLQVRVRTPLLKGGVDTDTALIQMIYLAQSLCATNITFYEVPDKTFSEGFVQAATFPIFNERKHMKHLEPFLDGCTVTDQLWFDTLSVTLKTCCGHVSPEHFMPPTLSGYCQQTEALLPDGSIVPYDFCKQPTTVKDDEEE